jgi:hypothetical protein
MDETFRSADNSSQGPAKYLEDITVSEPVLSWNSPKALTVKWKKEVISAYPSIHPSIRRSHWPSGLRQWYSTGGTRRHLRGYVKFKISIYILFYE